MPRVLFLTAHDPSERRYWNTELIDGLEKAGVHVEIARWSVAESEMIELAKSVSQICLISAGHYNHTIDAFRTLLSILLPAIQQQFPSVRICNAPALTLWNCEKTYLLDLQREGFRLPRTIVAERQTPEQFKNTLRDFAAAPSGTVIVKPSIGASGLGVLQIADVMSFSVKEDATLQHLLDTTTGKLVVQEFIADIKDSGELSLILVDGKFVAGVLKRARNGDFRVNSEYGGTAYRLPVDEVPQSAKDVGQTIHTWLEGRFGPRSCAYMRLDGVVRAEDNAFVVMEVECIEPSLLTGDVELCAELVQHFQNMFGS
ncbi:hypothetical protein AMS68_007024 [Peltaster fructicola]|uniref:ATP-grasp domain-containing protein n=1 Tax=Peltaster fructicola TaxID=286661 RepID=A0A6H0Y3C4_9PEZI|nr:hypothetical protein AMS68_007024 [Peltaster fructicola]